MSLESDKKWHTARGIPLVVVWGLIGQTLLIGIGWGVLNTAVAQNTEEVTSINKVLEKGHDESKGMNERLIRVEEQIKVIHKSTERIERMLESQIRSSRPDHPNWMPDQ